MLIIRHSPPIFLFFFFNDTATTEIYTLSLHDALPISRRYRSTRGGSAGFRDRRRRARADPLPAARGSDRKSTRLNSSHSQISYAVFCLKKKKNNIQINLLIRYRSTTDTLTALRSIASI